MVLVMLVCLFVGFFFLFKNKPTGFIPTEDEGRLYVTYEMPEATSTTGALHVERYCGPDKKNSGCKSGGWIAGLKHHQLFK